METTPNGSTVAYSPVYVPSKKYTKLGLMFIGIPFVAVLLLIVLEMGVLRTSSYGVAILFSGLTFLAAMVFFVFASIGLVLLFRRDPAEGVVFDPQSGTLASAVPPEARGWNWGAAFLGPIWGIYHGVWISLLAYVPLVNAVWWIVMGVNGNEWAWQKRKWLSPAHFKDSQWAWNRAGLAMVGYIVIVIMLEGVLLMSGALGMSTLNRMGAGGPDDNANVYQDKNYPQDEDSWYTDASSTDEPYNSGSYGSTNASTSGKVLHIVPVQGQQ